MPYWCARTEVSRERVAERFLAMAGYEVYCPRIRERGAVRVLFPSYLFIAAAAGWYTARWTVGVVGLIGLEGYEPTRIPDSEIDVIRGREKGGLVVLPRPPGLQRGDRVLVKRGPFADHLALYEGQMPHERVAVLLTLLGSQRRIELPKGDIVPA
jgi:transcriptional antiterminator RfaH